MEKIIIPFSDKKYKEIKEQNIPYYIMYNKDNFEPNIVMENPKYKKPNHYKNYIGQYGKRFYQPFTKEYIKKIDGFRDNVRGYAEFHFEGEPDDFWPDCEDTCIITNELPIKDIDWVANVNHPEYKGYNPFDNV